MKEPQLTERADLLASFKIPILCFAAYGLFSLPPMWIVASLAAFVVWVALDTKIRGEHKPSEVFKIPAVQRVIMAGSALYFAKLITYWPIWPWWLGVSGQCGYWLLVGEVTVACITYLCVGSLAIKTVPVNPKQIKSDAIGASADLTTGLRQHHKNWHQMNWQIWTQLSYACFMATFVLTILAIAVTPYGVGDWLGDWLLCSARDANVIQPGMMHDKPVIVRTWDLIKPVLPSESQRFLIFVKQLLAAVSIMVLWRPASRLSAFLTATCRQIAANKCGVIEGLIQTLRAPRTYLKLRDPHPFLANSARTFWWLLACYAFLFWLVGFSGGALGHTITNWLDASIADANFGMVYGALANPKLRMFCGAIVALYGAVPLAVTSCVWLPYLNRRQVILSPEGCFFPDGPYWRLGLRPMRLWSDFAEVKVHAPRKRANPKNTKLSVKFHSGGKLVLRLAQLDKNSLDKFLGAIDEHAVNCIISDEAIALRAQIRAEIAGARSNELGELSAENFQSTIFVPHDQGTWLPNGEARVVRLLASRPLSCVYLVRLESGDLAIAKQFYLAGEDQQRDALQKSFEREYNLLKKIDHPRISKVIDVFHRDQSTYLVLQHVKGTDLRTIVADDGPQSERKVINWALEICDLMTALHIQNPPIVHRDLTPDNLIVADDGSVRIIDFGAAHQFMEGITGTIIGKQCYVSPEQLRGQAGPLSDIYSFGCTLHYLLTGEEPVALTQCNPQDKLRISEPLSDLVKDCTEFEEINRPQDFETVKKRLLELRDRPTLKPSQVVSLLAEAAAEAHQQQVGRQEEEETKSAATDETEADLRAVLDQETAIEESSILTIKSSETEHVLR